uniref:Polymerase (DNA-directed), delta interacting protein 3 n=1 Tax=Sphaeramia orbicularis TaxID=375764 RepID=A0A672YGS0_9TELE
MFIGQINAINNVLFYSISTKVFRNIVGDLKLTSMFFVSPTFGRGAGGVGKSFDARQKIGVNDMRQRLVKDAREKLGLKDARFKIRGRGGAGGLQDARQMINSRKQGQTPFNLSTPIPQIQIHTNNNNLGGRMMDARDRLSLKRSIGGTQTQAVAAIPLKITKTIQVRLKLILI